MQKWGNDDYPFLSTIQFQGIMNLLFGILVIGGMLKLIIGDKDKQFPYEQHLFQVVENCG